MISVHSGRREFLIGAFAAAALSLGAFTQAAAQLGSYNPPPGPQGSFAIRGGNVITGTGTDIPGGTVVISGGKITAVGANVSIPSGAQVIDAKGLDVYPGMIDAGTSMGLVEISESGVPQTVDQTEVGSFNPNAQAFFGIDPHSAHVGTTRVVGVTTVVSRPTGGIISGQAALINLAGDTPPKMAIEPRVALAVQLPRSGFAGRGFRPVAQQGGSTADVNRQRDVRLDSLRQMLRDADAYGKALDAFAKDPTLPRPQHDVVLASLLPAVHGDMPVMFIADRANDIRDAVSFAEEMHLKPIIVGGEEAAQVAPFLKQHNVPVIVTSVLTLPSREDDPYDINYSLPAKLQAAGVRYAIASGAEPGEERDLPYVAGMAAAFGLSKADALRAVTLSPAQIFGVGDKLGTIEVGKMANVVVTTGDMLEPRTDTRYLFIDGRPVPLDTKHSDLYKMFKDRP